VASERHNDLGSDENVERDLVFLREQLARVAGQGDTGACGSDRCAVAVQRATAAREAELPPERRIEFRVGNVLLVGSAR
jgi:hypothetical protein